MGSNHNLISVALASEYPDFLAFCLSAEKEYTDEITAVDYVAFRAKTGVSREVISEIKQLISSYVPVVIDSLINDTDEAPKGSNEEPAALKLENNTETENHQAELVASNVVTNETKSEKYSDEPEIGEDSLPLYTRFSVQPAECDDHQIDELGLRIRTYNALKSAKCNTIGKLLRYSVEELKEIRNLGATSIQDAVYRLGVFFADPHWKLAKSSKVIAHQINLPHVPIYNQLGIGPEDYDAVELKDACELNVRSINALAAIDCHIITPYTAQVKAIREALWKARLPNSNVVTVHKSQGREWDTVLFSAVDTDRKWFTDSNCKKSNGKNVLNTAVSRAKRKLIMVCDYGYWRNQKGQLIGALLSVAEQI